MAAPPAAVAALRGAEVDACANLVVLAVLVDQWAVRRGLAHGSLCGLVEDSVGRHYFGAKRLRMVWWIMKRSWCEGVRYCALGAG
jgi:hypothetical protein